MNSPSSLGVVKPQDELDGISVCFLHHHRCTEQATNKVVVTTIEELDLDSNAMSAAAAQGMMLLENDNNAGGGEEACNGKQRKSGGGGGGRDGKSEFTKFAAQLSTGISWLREISAWPCPGVA